MINFEKYTNKAKELLNTASVLANKNEQSIIDNGHVLLSLCENDKNVLEFIFNEMNKDLNLFTNIASKQVDSYPKTHGGQPTMSNDLFRNLQAAEKISKDW